MPRTPDRFPGGMEEDEEILLDANLTGPSAAGAFNFDGTSFQMRDSTGTFNPRSPALSATAIGQVLFSIDGTAFTARFPIVADSGWLLNDLGLLLVQG